VEATWREWTLSDDPTRFNVTRMAQWLRDEAYWAVGRSEELVARSVANSVAYGVYDASGEMVAGARVITDDATLAWICDVFVANDVRGQGLGTWMVGEIVNYWSQRGVLRLLLATRDAHDVYAKVGFVPAVPGRFMEIDRRVPF